MWNYFVLPTCIARFIDGNVGNNYCDWKALLKGVSIKCVCQ